MIEWSTIGLAVLGSVSIGELINLFTLREHKKGLKIDNKQKEDERWEKLVNELQEQNNKLQEQNTMLHERLEKKDARIIELEDRSTTLQEKLDQTRTRCSVGELLRCVKVSCPDREPKLGTRQLDVEQMMEDTYGS